MEVLPQDEIDRLLTSIMSEPVEPKKPRPPDVFSREQMRALCIIHENFSWIFTRVLSQHLKAKVDVGVASVDQITYGEFQRSVMNPSILITFDVEGLGTKAVLEMGAHTYAAIVHHKIGKTFSMHTNNDMFHGQYLHAISSVVKQCAFGPLSDSWEKVAALKPKFEKIDTDPNLVNIAADEDMVLDVMLETHIEDPKDSRYWVEGMMNLCIPASALKPLMDRLSTVNLDEESKRYNAWKDEVYKTMYKDDTSIMSMEQLATALRKNEEEAAEYNKLGNQMEEQDNYEEAVKLYSKAAEMGNANAMVNLGVFYYKGLSVAQNHQTAFGWFKRAAGLGDSGAQFLVGHSYENGIGIAQDKALAIEWYRKSAEGGDEEAKVRLEKLEQ